MNGPDYEMVAREAKANAEAATQVWAEPDLSLLVNERGNVPPLPLDLFPPAWRRWLIETAEGTGAPVDFVMLGLLGAVAGLTGCGVEVEATTKWREPLVLWMVAVGAPSTGKSPALSACRNLVETIEMERRRGDDERQRAHTEKAELAKIRADVWRAEVKQAVANDETPSSMPPGAGVVEPFVATQVLLGDTTLESVADVLRGNSRGVILWRDELNAWLANMGRYTKGTDQPAWLEAWPATPLTVNRKGKPPVTVTRFAVSVLGGIQPDRLREVLKKVDDGLAVRFLLAWPDAAAFVPPSQRRSGDDAAALSRLRWISDAAGDAASPRIIGLDTEACLLLDEFMRQQHTDAPGLAGFEAGWFGKYGHVLRLAGVLALLDASESAGGLPIVVTAQIFQRADDLWAGYFWPHARAALRISGGSPQRRHDRRVALWLRTNGKGTVSAEEIRRDALGQALDAAETGILIGRLEAMGLLRPLETRGRGPGRPAARWEVNPALFEVTPRA